MRNILFILLVIVPFAVKGQSAADKLFDKYSGKEGFTSVYITKYMFSMFANAEVEDEDFNELVNNLSSIKILATEDSVQQSPSINFYKEIMSELPEEEYKELMVIKEKGQDVKFLIREVNGKISELLLIAGGEDANALISIQGNIDLKNISKLSKSMKINGLEHLDKMDERK